MLAQVINWISPIRVGDFYRVWHIQQHSRNSWLWVASSILIEKSADSLVLAVFAIVLAVSPMPNQSASVAIRLCTDEGARRSLAKLSFIWKTVDSH